MERLKQHWKSIVCFLIFAFILSIPAFFEDFKEKDDAFYHYAHILVTEKSISENGIPSKILPEIGYDFGYGTRLFYPPLSHTVTSYVYHGIKNVGGTVEISMALVNFIGLALSGITMYFLGLKVHKDKKLAFFAGLFYMTMPYYLSDIYVRGALAEVLIFPFLPLIVSGVISLLDGDVKKFFPPFVIGYTLAVLTHFTIMIYFTIILAIFMLIYHKKIFKKKFLIPFIIGCISVFGMLAFFFEPLLTNQMAQSIGVFLPNVMTQGVYWSTLWPHEYFPFFRFTEDIVMTFALVPFVLGILGIIKRKELEQPKYLKGFIVFFLVCLLISSRFFFWDILPNSLLMIQFAWRIVGFLGFAFAILAPLYLQKVNNKKILAGLVILTMVIGYFGTHSRTETPVNFENVTHDHVAMGWQHEYLPKNAFENEEYVQNRSKDIISDGPATIEVIQNQIPDLVFKLSEIEGEVVLELPRYYYLGYELSDSDGNKYELKESPYGLIEVRLSKSGEYTLVYAKTSRHRLCEKISIATLIISVGGYGFYIFKKKKSN